MPQLKWDWKNDFLQQLNGNLADDSLNLMLESYDAINLSNNEVSKKYPNGARFLEWRSKMELFKKILLQTWVKRNAGKSL